MRIEDLLKPRFQCIHFSDTDPSALETTALNVFSIDGARVQSKEHLLSAVSKEMRFPTYFGNNWDALDECLRDLSWLEMKGCVLVVRHAEALWRRLAFPTGKLCEIWLSAAEQWAGENVAFHLVFILKEMPPVRARKDGHADKVKRLDH